MNKLQQTSLLAYAEILESLNFRQIKVLKAIKKLRFCNNLMISKHLKLPINSITGRTYELRKKGLIKEIGKASCPFTKKLTIFFKVKRNL